jgi:hypothetical protein
MLYFSTCVVFCNTIVLYSRFNEVIRKIIISNNGIQDSHGDYSRTGKTSKSLTFPGLNISKQCQ